MNGEHVVMSGSLHVNEVVEVEEVVVESPPRPLFPKVRVPRIPLHNFLPTFTDERAHDLL